MFSVEGRPGRAMKASACLPISDFLSCMSTTVFTSPMVSPEICHEVLKLIYSITGISIGRNSKRQKSDNLMWEECFRNYPVIERRRELRKASKFSLEVLCPKKWKQGNGPLTLGHGTPHWTQFEKSNPLGLHFHHHKPNWFFCLPGEKRDGYSKSIQVNLIQTRSLIGKKKKKRNQKETVLDGCFCFILLPAVFQAREWHH